MTGLGVTLRDLAIGAGEHATVRVENEGRRPGRPLIEREDRPRAHGGALTGC